MPGEPLNRCPARFANSTATSVRGLMRRRLRAPATWASCPTGLRRHARGAAPRPRGQRPDRRTRRRVGGRRGRPHLRPAVAGRRAGRLWQIAIAIKPLDFEEVRRAGRRRGLVHGPAGNPVSSFITFLLVVRPAPWPDCRRPAAVAGGCLRADFDWLAPRQAPRVPARAPQRGRGLDLFPANAQSSGVLTSAVWAMDVVDQPPGGWRSPRAISSFAGFADMAGMKIQVPSSPREASPFRPARASNCPTGQPPWRRLRATR